MVKLLRNSIFFRRYSTYNKIKINNDHLSIIADNGKQIDVPTRWLLDHCRCSKCYNYKTYQRCYDASQWCADLGIDSAEIDKDMLNIVWTDSPSHNKPTTYDIKQLVTIHGKNRDPNAVSKTRVLWGADKFTFPKVGYESITDATLMENPGLQEFYKNIYRHGACIVSNTPIDNEFSTHQLCDRIALRHLTLFGSHWNFRVTLKSQEMLEKSDTAYTDEELLCHNDSTYLKIAPGIQVFHFVEIPADGGETRLSDGFYCSQKLKAEKPKYYDCLLKTPIAHEYIGDGHHFYNMTPVINEDAHGNIESVRYNPYDRAPFYLTKNVEHTMSEWYEAYHYFGTLLQTNANERLMKPGECLFVDNWRVLHGRGRVYLKVNEGRRMIGCYLQRDSFISALKMMKYLI